LVSVDAVKFFQIFFREYCVVESTPAVFVYT